MSYWGPDMFIMKRSFCDAPPFQAKKTFFCYWMLELYLINDLPISKYTPRNRYLEIFTFKITVNSSLLVSHTFLFWDALCSPFNSIRQAPSFHWFPQFKTWLHSLLIFLIMVSGEFIGQYLEYEVQFLK